MVKRFIAEFLRKQILCPGSECRLASCGKCSNLRYFLINVAVA
jgi:hypothetical protein